MSFYHFIEKLRKTLTPQNKGKRKIKPCREFRGMLQIHVSYHKSKTKTLLVLQVPFCV